MENKIMYGAVCSTCGKDCEVPFKPRNDRPISCLDCYKNSGNKETPIPTTNIGNLPKAKMLLSVKDTSIVSQMCVKTAAEIVRDGVFDDKEAFDQSFMDSTLLCVKAYKLAFEALE